MSAHHRLIFEALLPLLKAALACAPNDTLYRALWAAKVHIEKELGNRQVA
jgi:hypothetical protein